MELNVGALMVAVVEPEIDPRVAVIIALPATKVITMPVWSMLAIDESEEDQVTCVVMSCELPSLQVPVALNCWVPLTKSEGFAGVTAIDCKIGVTVKPLDPTTPLIVAVMLVVPFASAVAMPELLTLATLGALESQVACAVRSLLVPSL